ncbi:MAG: RecB family exonuclease [Acidobacteriota bacterium]
MLKDLILSQSSLQDYVDCPRRFELRYLLDLRWPAFETPQALELEVSQQRGHDFHHLLHQHAMGVAAEVLEPTIDDPTMLRWWGNYLAWQERNLPAQRRAELTLTTSLNLRGGGSTLLAAKYDLLTRLADGTLLIIDWKTGRPQRRAILANRLQTIVYRYVLARAGAWINGGQSVAPEQIRMIYWFAEDGSTVELQYSAQLQDEDEERLRAIVDEMSERFEFPLVSDDRVCRFCSYRTHCARTVEPATLDEWTAEGDEADRPVTISLDDLEEISL